MTGLDHTEFANEEAGRLTELRLLAEEDMVEALLAQGAHRDALPRLRELVSREPYRERFAAQLMLALYRSAQQVEALNVYRRAAARLREELGIDPGRELQDLQRMICCRSARWTPARWDACTASPSTADPLSVVGKRRPQFAA